MSTSPSSAMPSPNPAQAPASPIPPAPSAIARIARFPKMPAPWPATVPATEPEPHWAAAIEAATD